MALFEYAENIGLLNESISYHVKKNLKTIKWAYSKNLILKGDIEGLKDRLTGLLDNCKDVSDVKDLREKCGLESTIEQFNLLVKQAKNPEKYENEFPYSYFRKAFEDKIIKTSDIEGYVRWLKTTYSKMLLDKEKELSKK